MFRICKARYADLTGLGAAKYPGRWNEPGTPALYVSVELSTAVLEVLSHLPKDVIPKRYAVMKIRLSLKNAAVSSTYFDIKGNQQPLSEIRSFPSFPAKLFVFEDLESAEEVRDLFGNPSANSLGIFVPSAIVPAYNVVLFPHTPEFRRSVHLESVEPFEFHPALFPEDARISEEV